MEPTATESADPMRRCIGSVKYGIEAHEAPTSEFPIQPSQKPDGIGRMCQPHWRQYTTALRHDQNARKRADAEALGLPAEKPARTRRTKAEKAAAEPTAEGTAPADEDGPTAQARLREKVRNNGGSVPAQGDAPDNVRPLRRRTRATAESASE